MITGLLHLLPFNEKIDQICLWDSGILLRNSSEIVQFPSEIHILHNYRLIQLHASRS